MLSALLLSLTLDVAMPVVAKQKQSLSLGMSCALTGPAQEIGKALKIGAQLYFDNHNRHSDTIINLTVLDDGYEPINTVANTHEFITQRKVDALFGYMGTPTTAAIVDLISKHQVPLLFPYSGAAFLRNLETSNVINLRTSYDDEAMAHAQYFKDRGVKSVGIVIQADEFGLEAGSSTLKALASKGLAVKQTARFRRNTQDLAIALKKLLPLRLDAIVLIGTYIPVAEFINSAAEQGQEPWFAAMSFTSESALRPHLKQSSRAIVTEVVADPNTCQQPLCDAFRRDFSAAGMSKANRLHFEGYLNAYAMTLIAEFCLQRQAPMSSCIAQNGALISSQDPQLATLFKLSKPVGENSYIVPLN